MAEHDSDRENREGREPVEPVRPAEEPGGAGRSGDPGGKDGVPFDEEAAWAAIVAGYGEEPPDPPGAKPYRRIEDLALPPEPGTNGTSGTSGANSERAEADADSKKDKEDDEEGEERAATGDKETGGGGPAPAGPLGSSVSFAPGVGLPGAGPRDYSLAEPSDDDLGEEDEGHFVQPDPPLPSADATTKFAWLAVIGGPVLLLLAVMFSWDMTWWLTTLGIGGFLGGFATLVARMNPDDEDDDPGRGAVV
ncbi:hypothetical protein ACFYNZ_02455 [Streptomyces kebangsaanensis]|uniref:DUF308 domain-containing protein n=1 Tax=Streptomyces kebangsaanensis TaxID=864058 RepID=A0ABW6KKG2_9ACTN